MRVIKDTEENIINLISELSDSVKGMKETPEGTSSYNVLLYSESTELRACQIIEYGFYWKNVKKKLEELNRLGSIEDSIEEWTEEPIITTSNE